MGWLIFLGICLVGIGAVILQWWLKKKRLEELTQMAYQLGLGFSEYDSEGLVGMPFVLFSKGDGRGVENVMFGTWQGLELREFDYWYYEESSDGDGGRSKTYYRFSCALAWFNAYCPGLSVTREDLVSWVANRVGLPDIQLELEEFNRAFKVRCDERKFAFDFLDARMMQWMLGAGSGFSYEVVAGILLVYTSRLQPLALTPVVGTVKHFHDHIPRVVYELYGAGGSTKPGQLA